MSESRTTLVAITERDYVDRAAKFEALGVPSCLGNKRDCT